MDDIKTATPRQEERDGLTITYDDEKGEITFDWNGDTHPKYNFLAELSEEALLDLIVDQIRKNLDQITESKVTAA